MPTATHQTPTGRRVVVAGGGIGGLAAALALQRQGMSVTVLEQASAFGEVGAGIQLAPNAVRVLADWGLLPDIEAVGVRPDALVLRDALSGAELTRQRLDTEFVERYGAPYIVLHRADLHETLLNAVAAGGATLLTSQRVASVDDRGTDYRVVTTTGETYAADLVIGADGLNSVLRALISSDQPVKSNYVALRGTVPFEVIASSASDPDSVVAYLGPHCHLVQYRVRSGEHFNQVAVFESPLLSTGGASRAEISAELERAYRDCSPAVRAALPFIGVEHSWPMYDRDPIPVWTMGAMGLVGDAAHPMLQYLAQGGCQAILDARSLERSVIETIGSDETVSRRQWESVLSDYNADRQAIASRVQVNARLWGDSWHAAGAARSARNTLFAGGNVKDGRQYGYTDWLYAAD
jgi:3-hydroxybenzoate 6-monooxygenase